MSETKIDSRIPELDGIRAIAIWMVLLLHIIHEFPNAPGALAHIPKIFLLVSFNGGLGVDLFFVLSGFLITGILLNTKDNSHYFRNFYIRRSLRIFPLYFAVVFIWCFAYPGYGRYFVLSSVFGANLSSLLHIPHPHGPDVLWSLAIEEQFYLIWPLVVLLANRRTLAVISGSLFLGCPLLRGISAAHGVPFAAIYTLPWFRFDGLAAGSLLALWIRSELSGRRASVRIAALLLAILLVLTILWRQFGLLNSSPGVAAVLRYTLAYLFFGALCILVISYRGAKWTTPLRWRFLQFSGALSYCLYLVHCSVGDGYESVLRRYSIPEVSYFGATGALAMRAAIVLGLSFAIAVLSRKYLENPFLSLKDRFATSHQPAIDHPRVPALTEISILASATHGH
jgi:peptidoglycan/LPS O-acetylase OafA/YrhL